MVFTLKNVARLSFVAALLVATSNGAAFAQSATSKVYSNLPPCSTDSFVYQSGLSESIYGDEGVGGPPPMMGFSKGSRIASGINGQNNAGLTTGHGSYLPDAWGADEFVGNEWDMTGSGSNTGNYPAPVYAPTGTFGGQVYGGQGQFSGNTGLVVPVNGQLSLSSIPSSPALTIPTTATQVGAAVGSMIGSALTQTGY